MALTRNRVAETASGVTTRYLVDDLNPTGYAQVVEETVNGAPEREYTYGLQRIDEGQIVNNSWTVSFYGYDGFGTVRELTNSAGAVTDTWEYDAFGNVLNHAGSTANEMLYRGEQFDFNLGLYYLRARYYNPLTGRFMSRDPNAGRIGIPASLHKYLYAEGDPVNEVDPMGRDADEEYSFLSSALIQGGSAYTPFEAFVAAHSAEISLFNCITGALVAAGDFAANNGHWDAWGYAGGAQALWGCLTLGGS